MKHCPQCGESYADDSLNYCLNDGTPLVTGADREPPTEVLRSEQADRPTVPIIPQATYHVPQQAPYAPGPVTKKGSSAWIWVLGILGALVLLCGGGFAGLIYIGSQANTANVNSSPSPSKASPSPTPLLSFDETENPTSPTPGSVTDITMAQYEKITIGMRRADVEKILGSKGEEISSTSGGGVNFAVIQWEGKNYKSIIITFQDDKVFTRSQAGLK